MILLCRVCCVSIVDERLIHATVTRSSLDEGDHNSIFVRRLAESWPKRLGCVTSVCLATVVPAMFITTVNYFTTGH